MGLVEHADREMTLAGLKGPAADYDGMIYEGVMALMKVFASQGHSGGSAHQTREIFTRLSNFENLTGLTDDPKEWMDVSEVGGGIGKPLWQSRRNPSFFSGDAGKTWYDINKEPNGFR